MIDVSYISYHIPPHTCKQCKKQYTREITDDFRYRWHNYKSNSRKFDWKESCMQEHLYRHFSSPGHRELPQLTKRMDRSLRKRRLLNEDFKNYGT